MSMLPTYKDITELLKKGLTLEAQEKIMQLREAAVRLQDETLTLKRRVAELEAQLSLKQSLRHTRSLYYADRDPVPFCPYCWENSQKMIHLFGPKPMMVANVEFWECAACQRDYSAKGQTDPFKISRRRK